VVGRRSDPDTGKIYHLKYSPPPSDVPLDRLVHRADDTEDKIKVTHTIHIHKTTQPYRATPIPIQWLEEVHRSSWLVVGGLAGQGREAGAGPLRGGNHS
jgi:hypothetical protein